MWFNNAVLYHYELDPSLHLETVLAEQALKPCPPHARLIYGWLPVFAGQFAPETQGNTLICMGKEERILPRGVIQRLLAERIETLETQRGRALKRAERSQMAEELEFELLPKAFCLQKRLPALFDSISKRLMINTASASQATQLLALLRKSIPALHIEPIQPMESLSMQLANWISNPSAIPPAFELASNCLLFSPNDDKKRVSCKGYELPADEVLMLINQGLAVSEIAMVWKERIQFTLTHDLILKRVKCLDTLLDEFNETRDLEDEAQQQDANLILLAGEWRALTNDLLSALSAPREPITSKPTLEACAF